MPAAATYTRAVQVFVTAAAGTERALKEELRELGLGSTAERGGVRMRGSLTDAAIACFGSRIAVRVLVELASFECPDADALYEGIRAIEWERFATPDHTVAVSAVSNDSALRHTNFVAQRAKDGIVDRQRARHGRRSSVDRRDPDVAVFVHLKADRAGVFLDASGRSLHLRGWRTEGGEAPLKETLAAALLRMSGWDREMPLHDPMCGSGTFAIEAELWSRAVPPQRPDRQFGFMRWASFDVTGRAVVDEVIADLRERVRLRGAECSGSDRDPEQVERARTHAERARSNARFDVASIEALRLQHERGQLVLNPPYGERLAADREQFRALARALDRLPRHRVSMIVPEQLELTLAERAPPRSHRVFNGAIPCRLLTWEAL